jgi:hypothetical protein
MPTDPVKTLNQMIQSLVPKVTKVVETHSKRMWERAVSYHLTGGTGSDRLARRTGTLARSTRPKPVVLEGSKVVGGLAFGAKYAKVHIGPAGSGLPSRLKTGNFWLSPCQPPRLRRGWPGVGLWLASGDPPSSPRG